MFGGEETDNFSHSDSNRQRVISHPALASIIEDLSFEATVYAALTSLLNVSLDYGMMFDSASIAGLTSAEPAQKVLKDNDICLALINLLSGPVFSDTLLDQMCDLFWLAIEDCRLRNMCLEANAS